MAAPQAWMDKAACRGEDTHLFFPDPWESDADQKERIAAARSICARCPVTEECFEWGRREKWGIWGGRTDYERRKLSRRKG